LRKILLTLVPRSVYCTDISSRHRRDAKRHGGQPLAPEHLARSGPRLSSGEVRFASEAPIADHLRCRSVITPAVYVVRFATELVLLAAIGFGARALFDGFAGLALAVVSVIVAATTWALLIGPKAPRRLPDPSRFITEVALFVWGAAGLIVAGSTLSAVLFIVLALAAAIAIRVVGEPAVPQTR
jgi:hypothetical protein